MNNIIEEDLKIICSGDLDWGKFKNSVRKNVNRCIEESVEVKTLNKKDEYREFYNVYCAFRKESRLSAFPFTHLLAHAQLLKPEGHFEFFAAFYNKHIIATLAVNIHDGIVTEVLSANTPYSNKCKLNPNDLLKWEIIKWG